MKTKRYKQFITEAEKGQLPLTPLTERRSEEGEKALPTMSLSRYTTSKSEERRGFDKPHNGLKWKGKNTTAD